MTEFNPATMNPASIILPSTIEKFNEDNYFEYFIIFIILCLIIFIFYKKK